MARPEPAHHGTEPRDRAAAPGIVTFKELQDLCRPNPADPRPRLSTVERWARRQGIKFRYDGDGGIFTTLDAIDRAIRGGDSGANDAEPPVSDMI